jgi:hypothetical protein
MIYQGENNLAPNLHDLMSQNINLRSEFNT